MAQHTIPSVFGQLNAIAKHCNRNRLSIAYVEQNGEMVYAHLADGGYITYLSLVRRDYAELLSSRSRSYAAIMY